MKLACSVLLTIFLLAFLPGCGGGKSVPPVQPVTVSVSPTSVSLIAGATQQFTATVHNSSNHTVSWTVSGTSCSGAACGTITSAGLYTAPTPVPSAMAIMVTATAAADSSKAGTATANLVPVSVAISPSSSSVYQRDMTQLTVTVTGTADTSVTWSINGLIGGGCSTGYIFPTGLYTTALCDIFNPPQTFTITATSNADPSKSGTAQVTVTGASPNNSRITGDYALLFRGYDLDGPMAIAGRVTADGAGGMIGGILGLNRASNTILISASGNYSVGADGRGTMYLGSYLFRFVLGANGEISILDFDEALNNPIRGTGKMKKQDSSAFSLAAFNGDFALRLAGDLNGSPLAMIGAANSDNTGALQGEMDAAMPSGNLGSLPLTGILTAPDPLSGFGTLELTPTGLAVATPITLEYFIVSTDEAYVVGIDPRSATVPSLSGELLGQSGEPFTSASLNVGTVLHLTGVASSPGSHVILAQSSFDGNGNLSGISDENNNGTPATAQSFTGTYSVASDGRGIATLSIAGGSTAFTFYLVSPNEVFLVAGSPGTPIGEVMLGTIEAQTGAPFSASSIAGTYAVVSIPPSTASVAGTVAAFNLTSTGAFTGSLDSCTFVACALSASATGTFTFVDTNTGRGTASLTGIPGSSVFYAVSPNKLYLLNSVTSGDAAAAVEVLQK